MKKTIAFTLFFCVISLSARAEYFLNLTGSHLNLDYKTVETPTTVSDITGSIQLIGIGGGYTTLAPGTFGYDLGLNFLGTNSESLTPNPDWGVPWYYKISAHVNYSFTFGLYFQLGTEVLSSFYQNTEHHYFGIGLSYGLGYRISPQFAIAISGVNSSMLFSGQNTRVLRGEIIECSFLF